MKLMTKELEKKLPPLYANEELGLDAIAHAKFFTPDSNWTWYATEYNAETGEMFGLIDGQEKELGYFTLQQLESLRGRLNLPVERDRYWTPKTLKELMR